MLELPSLRICPHLKSPPANKGQLSIVDPTSGAVVGEVLPERENPSWLRWLLPATLRICEEEDRSLVFTLRRSWPLSAEWLVFDAEQRHIGTVRSGGSAHVDDSQGRCLARLDHTTGELLSPEGTELAALRRHEGEVELLFVETGEMNPFSRMLLLAAALVCR